MAKSPSNSDGKKRIESDLSRFLSGKMSPEELKEKGPRLKTASEGIARIARQNMKRLGLSRPGDDTPDDTPKTLDEAMQQVEQDDALKEVTDGLIDQIKKRAKKKREHEDN
ncbi:MAG TPA: hypothetical protein VI873_02380 [Candidatus Peribacteraceae bacterium]|nr:hypothetical protein [Candidatus Peribacteraceae bacterium]